ncbi:MAG: hypothetical protein JXR87_09535 [Candidatus Marinimicrobia bacterium]|nr:hypothetical protein [Candidatus Neomarinimicrobiota bacterium]
MVYLIIPISFFIAFGIQVIIRGIPDWVNRMIINWRIEESISGAIIKGSAVRRETQLRKNYEKSYRENRKEWNNNYEDLLRNRNKDEIKEMQKKLEEAQHN